jgi:hypothetical protein
MNKLSNSEIDIFWNIHNTIFNMLVTDEIIQCLCVCVHLQTNTVVSGNANDNRSFTIFTHTYARIGVPPLYMGCCYDNKIKQLNKKVKNSKDKYISRTNHLWGPLVSIQMQYLFLIKLLNKREIKSLKQEKYIFLIPKPPRNAFTLWFIG